MEKINISVNVCPYPMPVSLVGAVVNGRINFMAVAWLARVNLKPPIIGVAINKRHHTPAGIRENEAFSVNFPSADLMEKTDYCGLVSGREMDKSGLFAIFHGQLDAAPMIKECPLCLECKLVKTVSLATNELFLGEIKGVYTEERYLTDGKPDVHKMNLLILTRPDNNYWTVGAHQGKAWSVGKKLKSQGD
jgi:flavin reductase (DIM6/NTAB) family NADH-FMN oxidoreductase RutF